MTNSVFIGPNVGGYGYDWYVNRILCFTPTVTNILVAESLAPLS